jgi:hypothetical protein
MKNKNVILGLLAVIFAVGSAYASLSSGTGYWKIKYFGEEEIVCAPIADCPGGSFECKAQLNSGNSYVLRLPNCPLLPVRTASSDTPIFNFIDEDVEAIITN